MVGGCSRSLQVSKKEYLDFAGDSKFEKIKHRDVDKTGNSFCEGFGATCYVG